MTPKQCRFVEEFLVHSNAAKAAREAGYSEKTARSQGQRLLTNADIAQAVAEGQAALAERTETTLDRLVRKTQDIFMLAMGLNSPVLDRYGKSTGEERRQLSAAKGAVELEAKLTGHLVERKDVMVRSFDQMSRDEIEAELASTRARLAKSEAIH